jgi:hypothetical protein
MQQLMFKLDQNPNGRGLRCDDDGLFLERDALLQKNDEGNFEARTDAELQKTFGRIYGGETKWESHIRSVKLVANALNKDDMAKATMTAVLMRLPDPGAAVRIADTNGSLAKAGYDPDEPRDERGRWTNGGDDGNVAPSAVHRDPHIQVADAGMSDASNDPVAEAVARAAAEQRRNSSGASRTVHSDNKLGNFWQVIGSNLLDRARSALSEVGHAEVVNSNANLAAGAEEAHTIAQIYSAYDGLMEHHTGGCMPITPETPIWGYGENASLAPCRPIVVDDFVAPAATALTIFPADEFFAAPAQVLRYADEGRPFIVLPKELPKDFVIIRPIGRYEIPTNAVPGTTTYGDLVGKQIGNLMQDRLPDVPMILRLSPGQKGVDIELPELQVDDVGARYLEIKPLTDSGFRSFRSQIARWKLTEPVLPVTYDYDGNIYYGFPR